MIHIYEGNEFAKEPESLVFQPEFKLIECEAFERIDENKVNF